MSDDDSKQKPTPTLWEVVALGVSYSLAAILPAPILFVPWPGGLLIFLVLLAVFVVTFITGAEMGCRRLGQPSMLFPDDYDDDD